MMCNWSDVFNEVVAMITDCEGSEPPGRDATEDHQSQGRPLELAKQLGSASQACKIIGYSRDRFYRLKELYE
jgi:hypothetical protein